MVSSTILLRSSMAKYEFTINVREVAQAVIT
jgi:hypothetical protein